MSFISDRQRAATLASEAESSESGNILQGKTPAQARDYIDANVSDLASAKTALKNVAGLLVVLQVQIDELKSGG